MKSYLLFIVVAASSALFNLSCMNNIFWGSSYFNKVKYNISLEITTEDSVTIEDGNPLKFKAHMISKNNDIAVLGWEQVYTGFEPFNPWFMQIIYEDGTSKQYPVWILYDRIPISKKSYIEIKQGEAYSFDFEIEFDLIDNISSYLRARNKEFGDYYFTLLYQDLHCKHKNSFRNYVISNTTRIKYIDRLGD